MHFGSAAGSEGETHFFLWISYKSKPVDNFEPPHRIHSLRAGLR